jgi:glycosyl-4,4'-diaponeurosporenoate acyltransferase
VSGRRLLVVIALDAAAWAAVQVGTGYLAHRLPVRVLDGDGWLWRERRWERGGRFYVDVTRIRRWKRLLPEAGAAFAGGFDKRRLRGRGSADLERFAVETRRAELGHWLAVLPAPVFVALNPPVLAPFMAAYALAVNVPCIAAQRYNRIRLRRAADRVRRPA